MERATQNAKVQVVAFLGSDLRGRLTHSDLLHERRASGNAPVFSRETATLEVTELEVTATDLPGLVVAERCLDRQGHAAYALAYLDCAVAERALGERVGLLMAEGEDLLGKSPGQGPRSGPATGRRASPGPAREDPAAGRRSGPGGRMPPIDAHRGRKRPGERIGR